MLQLKLWISMTFICSLVVVCPLLIASGNRPVAAAVLSGIVREADGKALEGVAVSARAVDGTITTSVYTDREGYYYFPVLPAGRYRVWAQAVGYQAGRADVILATAHENHPDFILRPMEDFSRQLTSPEWLSSLPDERLEDRRLKQIFIHSCTTCHSAAFALQNRFDEKGWQAILARMETIDVYGKADGPVNPIIQHYMGELAPYLTRMRGPGASPTKIKPFPRPVGDAARTIITEYSVPSVANPTELVDQDGSDWSEGIPSEGNGSAGLHDIAIDQNGNAWVTNGTENRNRSFIKLDVETGKVTNFRLPAPNGFARGTHGAATDQSGIVWLNLFTNGGTFGRGSLLRIDPATEKLEEFAPPAEMGTVGISIQVDAKGKIWAASDGAIAFDPFTKKFAYFKPLTPGTGGYGVTGDADGNGWFCHPGQDIVGFAEFATQKVGEIRLPPRPGMDEISSEEDRKFYQHAQSTLTTAILPAQGPRRMAAQGDYVWWSNWFGQSISRANIRTHEVKYYNAPLPNVSPYDMAVDKEGMMWVVFPNDDRVARLDPLTERWTVYNLPSRGTNTRFITVDNHNGSTAVWAASFVTSKVVRLQFRTREQMQTFGGSNADSQNAAVR